MKSFFNWKRVEKPVMKFLGLKKGQNNLFWLFLFRCFIELLFRSAIGGHSQHTANPAVLFFTSQNMKTILPLKRKTTFIKTSHSCGTCYQGRVCLTGVKTCRLTAVWNFVRRQDWTKVIIIEWITAQMLGSSKTQLLNGCFLLATTGLIVQENQSCTRNIPNNQIEYRLLVLCILQVFCKDGKLFFR